MSTHDPIADLVTRLSSHPTHTPRSYSSPARGPQRRRWQRVFLWTAGILTLLIVALVVVAAIALNRAEPWLRARVVDTLATRFDANVQLDQFHASAAQGFAVTGAGLRIIPHGLEAYPPVISVDRFSFHMRLAQLFSDRRHVRLVHVDGLHITLPPGAARPHLFGKSPDATTTTTPNSSTSPNPSAVDPNKQHHITDTKMYFDEISSHDAVLTLLTSNPAKEPLVFNISKLHLVSQLTSTSMHYTAQLSNPVPAGEITSEGEFGPWNEENPRVTPIAGNYSFDHADLATIKGIAGILSSTGKFSGPLDHLTVDGQTQTPDFRIAEAGHPVALFTQFHAIVDGTNGDTYLQPVQAHFRNTWFTCNGSIVRIPQQGHHIALQVSMTRARIEDLLWLGVHSEPPVITGAVHMTTSLDLPPDPSHQLTVAHRLGLRGNFTVTGVHFSSAATEKKIDSISLRTQGKPHEANDLSHSNGDQGKIIPDEVDIPATLTANFTLQNSLLNLHPGEFKVPGLDTTFSGDYTLDGQKFDFSGNAKLQATVSQMFTGWKSMLLKPVDPFFKKHGAGTYIPFHVGGTKEEPKFGLELKQH